MSLDLNDSAINEAWSEIRAEGGKTNWMLLGYDEENSDKQNIKVKLVGKGTGGYDEFVKQLSDDKALYGVFRVIAVDDDSRRTKFVFVTFLGSKLVPLKRARVSTHKSAFAKLFNGFHAEVYASSEDDLSKDEIVKKLNSATGAHKPKGYEFEN
ncbi:coactosin [Acrasis kona]|uniref:Coactosin n=1 Tax=Acrasis kona TaxID=1008807 RepID=A0AAW2Z433_9EUKA